MDGRGETGGGAGCAPLSWLAPDLVPLVGGPEPGMYAKVLGVRVYCCPTHQSEGAYYWQVDSEGVIRSAKWKRHAPLHAKPMVDGCKYQYGISTSDGYIPPACGECHECICEYKRLYTEASTKLRGANELLDALYDFAGDSKRSGAKFAAETFRAAIRGLRPR